MAAWCGNGAPLPAFKEKAEKGQWPFGPDNNSPEDNCCACGKGKYISNSKGMTTFFIFKEICDP